MREKEQPMDWDKTSFDGNRREQLRRARAMTVRQRLEAMDELAALSDRMRTMPRQPAAAPASSTEDVRERGTD